MAENLKLTHDANAGRFVTPTLPASLQNTDIGRYLTDLTTRLQDALNQSQRAFRTLGGTVAGTPLTVVTAVTFGTDSITIDTAEGVFLSTGATNRTVISGTNCGS